MCICIHIARLYRGRVLLYEMHNFTYLCVYMCRYVCVYMNIAHLCHERFLPGPGARLSCTANTRPLNEFGKGPNLAENRVEYVLLTT